MAAPGHMEVVLMDATEMPWKFSRENRVVAPGAGKDSGGEKFVGANMVLLEIVVSDAVGANEVPARGAAADGTVCRLPMLLELSMLHFPGSIRAGDNLFSWALRFVPGL